MTIKTLTAAALGAALWASTVGAQDAVRSIIAYGEDGGITFYQVRCVNGARGSIEVITEPTPQVCITPAMMERICRPHWPLEAAAEATCR